MVVWPRLAMIQLLATFPVTTPLRRLPPEVPSSTADDCRDYGLSDHTTPITFDNIALAFGLLSMHSNLAASLV
ncbi:hypothetical protein N7453_001202 [Penicillium expansum]|nr:hypothetical protein N7453_001202 [Penicillium expansum]